jgi:hypothetical protein
MTSPPFTPWPKYQTSQAASDYRKSQTINKTRYIQYGNSAHDDAHHDDRPGPTEWPLRASILTIHDLPFQ